MNQTAPKALRLHIGIFGRVNVGKSTLLNFISGQATAITSPIPGTTTDVVSKNMELLPIGPVVFLDTAGLSDFSELGAARLKKTFGVFEQADIITLVTGAGQWGEAEQNIVAEAHQRKIPLITVISKSDLNLPSPDFIALVAAETGGIVINAFAGEKKLRDQFLNEYKRALIEYCPENFLEPPALIGDLVKPGETVILLTPIDLQAPKGRLILPQVQVLRSGLDNNNSVITVKETEYQATLNNLKIPAALIICDSQVVDVMVRETPPEIACTTFSILFARLKGNMELMAAGAAAIERLKTNGGRVLIAEACTHHATDDDIGRVKIPNLLRRFTGRKDLVVDVFSGTDYPDNLAQYDLVIHCGGCMFNRRAILSRIQLAVSCGVAVTNYGMCISFCHGVLERVLSPFPVALAAFRDARSKLNS